MYGPGSRPSAIGHLTITYPVQAGIIACLVFAGFAVVTFASLSVEEQAKFVPLWAIKAYCNDPANPPLPLPAGVWKQFDAACHCVDYTCPS
jgi:hypothetical protein